MSIKQELQSPSSRVVGGLILASTLFLVSVQLLDISTPLLLSPVLF